MTTSNAHRCPYCPAEYSTAEEVARHLDQRWWHYPERLQQAEAERDTLAYRVADVTTKLAAAERERDRHANKDCEQVLAEHEALTDTFRQVRDQRDAALARVRELEGVLRTVAEGGFYGYSEGGCAVCWECVAMDESIVYEPAKGQAHLEGCFIAEALSAPAPDDEALADRLVAENRPKATTKTRLQPPPRRCIWTDEDEEGRQIGEACGAAATWLSCVPYMRSPTCDKHKCRCAKPIAPSPAGEAKGERSR